MSKKLSSQIKHLFQETQGEITLKQFLSKIDQKSFGLMFVILSLPSAIPVPAPGYSSFFGVIIIYLAIKLIQGKPYPELPEKIMNKKLKSNNSKTFKSMMKFLEFFEKFLKPRQPKIFKNPAFDKLIAIFIICCGISMVSIIPLTNTLPALSVFLLGLSMVAEDFLFAVIGLFCTILAILLSIFIHYLFFTIGIEGVEIFKNSIKDFLF